MTTNITDSFDQAPPCVNQALQLIKERVSLVVQEDADFNEILTAAYMENQKMSVGVVSSCYSICSALILDSITPMMKKDLAQSLHHSL